VAGARRPHHPYLQQAHATVPKFKIDYL